MQVQDYEEKNPPIGLGTHSLNITVDLFFRVRLNHVLFQIAFIRPLNPPSSRSILDERSFLKSDMVRKKGLNTVALIILHKKLYNALQDLRRR